MIILGIDPGFERIGISVIKKGLKNDTLLFSICFKTSAKIDFNERLVLIGKEVRRVIKKYKPDSLAIETLIFNTNQKTALMVAEARGVIVYESTLGGLKIYEYTPLQIKNAVTGYGRADKNQVTTMVRQLIAIGDEVTSDDEIDSIAVSLTCSASIKNRFSSI